MFVISNFLLELYNIKDRIMKNLFFPVFILTNVLIIAGILIYQTGAPKNDSIYLYSEIIHVIIIAFFFILGIYFSIKKITSRNKGFREEDELSKRITQKAAAISFYISLFLWVIVLFIHNSQIIDTRILFGYCFIGVALTFMLSWFFINSKGIRNE